MPAGDPFQVYPGENGKQEESIRIAVTMQALQDLRACEKPEQLTSHDYVVSIIDGESDMPITFASYPRNTPICCVFGNV